MNAEISTSTPNILRYDALYDAMSARTLRTWRDALPQQIEEALFQSKHGDLETWFSALNQLPQFSPSSIDLNAAQIRIGSSQDVDISTQQHIEASLRQLHPWRKGPFEVFGIPIETEWRSDWKWDRLKPHISSLKDRTVLDIGCGSGYHCWRMAGEGAKLVIGLEPYLLYVMQFYALKTWIESHQSPSSAHVLPLGIEALPPNLKAFDTVFSMGVLYHRRSPFDHLFELRDTLKNGGELVLETLVIEGKQGEVLVPDGRYAKMRNVWFLPSVPTLESWLKRAGFKHIRCVDINQTQTAEQHSTDWMRFESLADFLDPNDPNRTIEGHPAPLRTIFVAES